MDPGAGMAEESAAKKAKLERKKARRLKGSILKNLPASGVSIQPERREPPVASDLPTLQEILDWDWEEMPPLSRAHLSSQLARIPMEVPCRDGRLRFLNINKGTFRRAYTLLTKEPDSNRWIDRMEPGSVFWDIGANVGVLSLYAAQRGDLSVHAFEPVAVNYYLLAANCELNGFQDLMGCYLLGFSDRTHIGRMETSQFLASASFSLKPKKARPEFAGRYQTCLVFSIDDFLEQFDVPAPNYIKIDVPGVTEGILRGAARTLARPELREIQVELKEQSQRVQLLLAFLETFGFTIVHRNRRPSGAVAELVLGRATDGRPAWD